MPERELEKKVAALIWKAYQRGITHFVFGGALGFDMLAAEQVIFIKDGTHDGILKPITLEIAIPCENQTRGWSKKQRQRYDWILAQIDIRHERNVPYSAHAMMMRNKYMVSKSALVIDSYVTWHIPRSSAHTRADDKTAIREVMIAVDVFAKRSFDSEQNHNLLESLELAFTNSGYEVEFGEEQFEDKTGLFHYPITTFKLY